LPKESLSAQALVQLHEAGLAHCDWKSSNLVLQRLRDGSILCKPIDFGFAQVSNGKDSCHCIWAMTDEAKVFHQAWSCCRSPFCLVQVPAAR
jgi:tRNA A-37 threonylcarbamoyl transferase component Bud32